MWRLSIVLLTAALAPTPLLAQTALAVSGLRVEYLTNPLGIDESRPRLSRQIVSAAHNTMQAAYQLQVGRSAAALS